VSLARRLSVVGCLLLCAEAGTAAVRISAEMSATTANARSDLTRPLPCDGIVVQREGPVRRVSELDHVVATVLFTDIVGSTQMATDLGNRAWRELVERHHRAVRTLLGRFRGVEMDTAGDGFFASFDCPARAIRCAQAIVEEVRHRGIEVRAGLHTGECETIDNKLGGIAVNIGARIGGLARPSEVLISQTVKDLVAGSGLAFRGTRGARTEGHLR
jgi:class 3 adenylate cyclase